MYQKAGPFPRLGAAPNRCRHSCGEHMPWARVACGHVASTRGLRLNAWMISTNFGSTDCFCPRLHSPFSRDKNSDSDTHISGSRVTCPERKPSVDRGIVRKEAPCVAVTSMRDHDGKGVSVTFSKCFLCSWQVSF